MLKLAGFQHEHYLSPYSLPKLSQNYRSKCEVVVIEVSSLSRWLKPWTTLRNRLNLDPLRTAVFPVLLVCLVLFVSLTSRQCYRRSLNLFDIFFFIYIGGLEIYFFLLDQFGCLRSYIYKSMPHVNIQYISIQTPRPYFPASYSFKFESQ